MKQTIASVTLVVDDYDEAIAFYTDALGFAPARGHRPGRRQALGARRAARRRNRAAARAGRPATRSARASATRPAGASASSCTPTISVATTQRCSRTGVRFLEAPRDEAYGTVAVFEDLYGNRWDLLELTP